MNKTVLLIAASVAAIGAHAQQQQIHILGGETPAMVRTGNVDGITYKGNATDGFTHMVVTGKGGTSAEYKLADETVIAVLHEGTADGTVTPVTADSEEFRLLTSRAWKWAGATGAGDGYTYPIDWIGDCMLDDTMTFTADGKVLYDLGATNEVYCEFGPAPRTFTATGDEGFVLGHKDGSLVLQFTGGAFPIYRAAVLDNGALYSMTVPYEVVRLTDTALEISAETTGGETAVISFSRKPEGLTTADMLCAKPWKVIDGGTDLNSDMWGAIGGSSDEVLTFKPDGSMNITGDGKAESANDGAFDYSGFDAMTWKLVVEDDKESIQFGGNGFPLAVGNILQLGGKWDIVSISPDKLTLFIAGTDGVEWPSTYYLILTPAE